MTEESRKQAPILVSLSIREMGYSPIVIDEASLTLFTDRVELCVPFTSFLVTILLKDVFQLQWRAATEELVFLTGTYVRREYVLTSRRSPSLWSTAPGPSFTAEALAALSDEELAARSAAPPTLAMMYDILRPRIVEREVQFPAGASSWLWEQAREGSVWTPAADASFHSGGGPAAIKTPFRTPMYQATALSSPHWNRSGPTDLTQLSASQPLEAMPGTQRAAAQWTMLRRRPPDLMTTTADMVQTPPPSRRNINPQQHQWNEAAPSSSLHTSGRREELEEVAALAKRMGGASSSRRTLYGANAVVQDVSHDYSRSNRSVEIAGHPQSVRQPPHKQEEGREEEEEEVEDDEHDRHHKATPLRAALRAMQLRKQNQTNGRSGGSLMVETPPQSQQARAMFQQWRSEVTESILAQKSSTPPSSANALPVQKQTALSVAGRGGSSPFRTQWAVTPDHGTTNPARPSPLAVPAENIECPPCPRWLLTRNVVVLQQQANALHQPMGHGGSENRQTTAPSSSSSTSLPPQQSQQPGVGTQPHTTTQPNYAHWLEGVVPATPSEASSSQPVPMATTTLHHVAQASTPDIPLARDSILDGIAIHHPYLPPNPGLTLTADTTSPRGGSTGRTPPLLKPQPIIRQGNRASPPTSQLQRVRQAQASSGSPPPPRLPSPSGSPPPPPPPPSQFAASQRDSSTPVRMMGGASAVGNRPPPPLARPRTPQGSVSNRAAGSSPSLYRSSSTAVASASEVGRLPQRRPPPRAEAPESQQGQRQQPTAYSAAALSPTRRQTQESEQQVRAGSPADGFGFGRLMSRRN